MTTTIFDKRTRIVACDSRWSIQLSDKIYFLDNAEFQKIAVFKNSVAMMAGDAGLIESWKNWGRSSSPVKPIPDILGDKRDFSIILIRKSDQAIIFGKGYGFDTEDYILLGSGSDFARQNWQKYHCPHFSVSHAIATDDLSGGNIKYFDLNSGEHNLIEDENLSVSDLKVKLTKEGYAMCTKTKKISSIRDLPEEDQLSAASLRLSAPIGREVVWTNDDVQELENALRELEPQQFA